MMSKQIIKYQFLPLLISILLTACGTSATTPTITSSAPTASSAETATVVAPTGSVGTIKLGSKNFTEEFIVAQMYGQLLENAGFTVDFKLNLGGTPVAMAAIENGDIDLYPEYTSTALLTVLNEQPLQNPTDIYNAVKKGYQEKYHLTWLDPSPFNDTQALAMTQAKSQQYGITDFSECSQKAPELILGGPAEFQTRDDGLPGLQKAYGGFQFKQFIQLGTGSLRYQALLDGQIDVVVAFSTDGQIQGDNLVLLKDDKHFYPVYNIAPVVRDDTLAKYPQIADVLNKLAPLLTTPIMSSLNWEVDGPSKKDPAEVAKTFLQQNGLLK
jgi:osmoprotectant transport system substrate-binding protein